MDEYAVTVELTFTAEATDADDAVDRGRQKMRAVGLNPAIVTDVAAEVVACDRCDGRGFTAESREGTRYVYECSACGNPGNKRHPKPAEFRDLNVTAEV